MSEESARLLVRKVGIASIGKRVTPHMFRHPYVKQKTNTVDVNQPYLIQNKSIVIL